MHEDEERERYHGCNAIGLSKTNRSILTNAARCSIRRYAERIAEDDIPCARVATAMKVTRSFHRDALSTRATFTRRNQCTVAL